MKSDAVSEYLVCNGLVRPVSDSHVFSSIGDQSIYEVIKLIDGIPLFFDDHLERMQQSARHLDMALDKSADAILHEIGQLVQKNRLANINVKLLYTLAGDSPFFLTYFIKQDFPTQADYLNGARTILYTGERKDPHLKTVGSSYRERVRNLKEAAGAYEALLVNESGFVCEGTRSNVFFLMDDQLCTSPADEVLLGVTRRHVLKVCNHLGINVKERLFHHRDLNRLQGAFITGTTIDVLPVGFIDELYLPSARQPVISKIAQAFAEEVRAYIESHPPPSSNPHRPT